MGVTLKEIAEMAGVHKSTVDKVIHNRPGVSDAKRQYIKKLLEEHGYEPNPLAKALNYQKQKIKVAVSMPFIDAATQLKDGMKLVEKDFNSFNIDIEYHVTPIWNPNEQAEYLRKVAEEKISGVVLLPLDVQPVREALDELEKAKIPVVMVNNYLKGAPHLCYVGQDMGQSGLVAARMMQMYLPQGGKIGVITSRTFQTVQQRSSAFRYFLPECSSELSIIDEMEISESNGEAYQKTVELLQRQPEMDGLFIACGQVAEMCRAIRDHNRAGQMKILSYESYPEIVKLVRDGEIACTLSGGLKEQGRLAMRLLFEYMVYEHEPQKKMNFTRNEILIRENI